MKKNISPDMALERLEDLCARSEQCTADLRSRLYRWGVPGQAAAHVIEQLENGRFVDDERFARAYVRDKYRFSRWGRRKIAAGLAAKRIPRHMISDALGEIDDEEYHAIMVAVLQAKARSMDDAVSYENRMKLLRFGASRGFEPGELAKIINSGELWR